MIGAFYLAGIERRRAHQDLEQCCFSTAVNPGNTEAHAWTKGKPKSFEHDFVIPGFRDPFQMNQLLCLAGAGGKIEFNISRGQGGPCVANLNFQGLCPFNARLGFGGPGTCAAGQPFGLAPHFVGQGVGLAFAGLDPGCFFLDKIRVAAIRCKNTFGVKFGNLNDARCDGFNKVAVVADDDCSGRSARQKFFQPHHPFDVQMVRWFIQEQQIRLLHEGANNGKPLGLSTRHVGHANAGFKQGIHTTKAPHRLHQGFVIESGLGAGFFQNFGGRLKHRQVVLLGHPCDFCAAPQRNFAMVGRFSTDDDLQQGRLAAAIGPKHHQLFAFIQGKGDAVQNRL